MFGSVKDNEANKFRGTAALPKVAVTLEDGIMSGVQWDDVLVTYPTILTEQYAFYLSSNLQRTIEITYSDLEKSILTRARII